MAYPFSGDRIIYGSPPRQQRPVVPRPDPFQDAFMRFLDQPRHAIMLDLRSNSGQQEAAPGGPPPAPAPAADDGLPDSVQTQLERYTDAVNELDSIPLAQREALIAAFGDTQADLAALRALSPEHAALVIRTTAYHAPGRPLVDIFLMLDGAAAVELKRCLLAHQSIRGCLPRGLTLDQLEFLVRETAQAPSPSARASMLMHYERLYFRSPITSCEWPSPQSVEHIKRLMELTCCSPVIDDTRHIALVRHVVKDCIMETRVKPSREVDALMLRLFSSPGIEWRPVRIEALCNALLENWPKVARPDSIVSAPALYVYPSIRPNIMRAIDLHNTRIANREYRMTLGGVIQPSAADDYATDVGPHQCTVCMVNARRVLTMPCTHVALCVSCFHRLPKAECPMCKTAVSSFQAVRLP